GEGAGDREIAGERDRLVVAAAPGLDVAREQSATEHRQRCRRSAIVAGIAQQRRGDEAVEFQAAGPSYVDDLRADGDRSQQGDCAAVAAARQISEAGAESQAVKRNAATDRAIHNGAAVAFDKTEALDIRRR